MKIYYGKNKLKAKRTSLIDLLVTKLSEGELPAISDFFSDESGSWIEIPRIENGKEVLVCFSFDYEGENIDRVSVYVAPVETKVNEEKRVKII